MNLIKNQSLSLQSNVIEIHTLQLARLWKDSLFVTTRKSEVYN